MKIQNLERAILLLNTSNQQYVIDAIDFLKELGNPKAIPFLRKILIETQDIHIRNYTAKALGYLKVNEAVNDLMTLIKNPNYQNNRGSLIYALQNLNYQNYLLDIVEIICNGNFECKHRALELIEGFEGVVKWEIVEKGREILKNHLSVRDSEDEFVKVALEIFEEVENIPVSQDYYISALNSYKEGSKRFHFSEKCNL